MKIELPYINNYKSDDYTVAKEMISSLFFRFANNLGSTSLLHHMDKFSNHNEANKMLIKLAKDGVIRTIPEYNYATIELNNQYSEEEMFELIRKHQVDNCKPISADEIPAIMPTSIKSKLASGKQETGIKRPGLNKVSMHKFQYDTVFIKKYYKSVVHSAIKAMKKMEKELGYHLMSEEGIDHESTIRAVIDFIMDNPTQYFSLGKAHTCSRGRAIFKSMSTVFNPLASKFARACIVAPECTINDESEFNDTYLYIAELVSGFDGNIDRKLANGKKYYQEKKLHSIDPVVRITADYQAEVLRAEKANDNLYENLWLERIYADLDLWYADNSHKPTTPIEVDFSSSNMVMLGLLLGHSDYVDHTQYMWQINGLSKLQIKKAQTPYVFGSKASVTSLWKKAGLTWTTEQVKLIQHHQTVGKFAIANRLKDIIIDYCTPEAVMNLKVADEEFKVECNRHTFVGESKRQYVIYNSETNKCEIISHTKTHKVPNLFRFRTYMVTGLIHNLDSQIMDYMCLKMNWVIPIWDAGIVTMAGAKNFKMLAVDKMVETKEDGYNILVNYLKSIGLTDQGFVKFVKLYKEVQELNKGKTMNITPYLLK